MNRKIKFEIRIKRIKGIFEDPIKETCSILSLVKTRYYWPEHPRVSAII